MVQQLIGSDRATAQEKTKGNLKIRFPLEPVPHLFCHTTLAISCCTLLLIPRASVYPKQEYREAAPSPDSCPPSAALVRLSAGDMAYHAREFCPFLVCF